MFNNPAFFACFAPKDTTSSPKKEQLVVPKMPLKMESLLLIVTGASRGLGKAIVDVMCLKASPSLFQVDQIHLILVARSAGRLEKIGREIVQHYEKSTTTIKLSCHAVDLSALDQLDANTDRIFQGLDLSNYDRAIFVNNHGSIGSIGPCSESPSAQAMNDDVQLNVTSCLWLSSRFAKLVQQSQASTTSSYKCKTTLVNISSLLAIESFPSMGIYGAGKAARDHYHRTMAKEIPSDRMKILNYAPGPLETDMVTEIRTAPSLDKSLQATFNKKLIEPKNSAWKLIKLLLSPDVSFATGDHVDYFDLPDDASDQK